MTINGPGFVKDLTAHTRTPLLYSLRFFFFHRRGAPVFARHVTVIIYSVVRYFHPYATNLDPIYLPFLSSSPPRVSIFELCEIDTRLGTRGASYNPILSIGQLNDREWFDRNEIIIIPTNLIWIQKFCLAQYKLE